MRFPALCLLLSAVAALAADFPAPFNSGNEKDATPPLSPEEAVKKIRLPAGFKATLFAGEPDVQNPIACAWDSRGRLWIAENYTYAEADKMFDHSLRDRILIFEDTDNDGRHDKRTVFADGLKNLTSIELGSGGVYATAAPHLLFFADKNRDDKPDGEPEIVLDGFDDKSIRHNFVNGLKWGPDGWLYGRHGILATSHVGRPGAPEAERVKINCGIWRFHPVRKTFEVVTWGGTNAWGHDWNAEGEGFFINTVIGHLYHIIPGAHYERMYGEDLNPHIYELLPQTADHYHFDTSKSWTDSRDGKANDLGGGHAHSGLMIYQGQNWPEQYRGKVFTINLHGRRINVERLERKGSGYVAKHEPDFAHFDDPWFRGVELTYGPDGGVYVLDWSDRGECHENDGVHRTSGRIYKITYGIPTPRQQAWWEPPLKSLADTYTARGLESLSDSELIQTIYVGTEWEARLGCRVLAERQTITDDVVVRVEKSIWDLLPPRPYGTGTFGALHYEIQYSRRRTAIGNVLFENGRTNRERVNEWAARNATELTQKASENANLRRLDISFIRNRPAAERLKMLRPMLALDEDNGDHLLPHLYWSCLEPLFHSKEAREAAIAAYSGKIHLVLRNTARRLGITAADDPAAIAALLKTAAQDFNSTKADLLLTGLTDAFRGVSKMAKPLSWDAFAEQAEKEPALADRVRTLNVIFGDGRALDEIRALALDGKSDLPTRRQALETLITSKAPDLRTVCEKLIPNRDLAHVAIRGLATFADEAAAKLAVANWGKVRRDAQAAVIGDFATRPVFTRALLDAIAAGQIRREELTPYHARQIAALNNPEITAQLAKVWGEVRTTPEGKKQRIAELKAALTPGILAKADIAKGREVFTQACAACHRLFDLGTEGTHLGPNLTGSGRQDLDYLLENIVDPNALVPQDYKLSVLTMKDGRTLSGFISAQAGQTITLRTMTDTQTVATADIVKTETSSNSLMPEGLLDTLTPEQVRDLFGFLMTK